MASYEHNKVVAVCPCGKGHLIGVEHSPNFPHGKLYVDQITNTCPDCSDSWSLIAYTTRLNSNNLKHTFVPK